MNEARDGLPQQTRLCTRQQVFLRQGQAAETRLKRERRRLANSPFTVVAEVAGGGVVQNLHDE